jgi:hypothetical protein
MVSFRSRGIVHVRFKIGFRFKARAIYRAMGRVRI